MGPVRQLSTQHGPLAITTAPTNRGLPAASPALQRAVGTRCKPAPAASRRRLPGGKRGSPHATLGGRDARGSRARLAAPAPGSRDSRSGPGQAPPAQGSRGWQLKVTPCTPTAPWVHFPHRPRARLHAARAVPRGPPAPCEDERVATGFREASGGGSRVRGAERRWGPPPPRKQGARRGRPSARSSAQPQPSPSPSPSPLHLQPAARSSPPPPLQPPPGRSAGGRPEARARERGASLTRAPAPAAAAVPGRS
ncbi:basic proline-rich protein-like [Canis lupus familiaris]|uniref:basic proline-rich protein-like n=1 Tax=Canis lupus familiaris TaxID=9615 RepID=UPI0018F56F7A|nr:basic proline-rich protein-like [Canis lupus familiaris]